MTNYSAEYEKAREVRSNAVMSIRSVRNLKIEAETRRDDLLPILFGDGTNQGIMKIISLYMEQARLTAGRKTSTPDFSGDYESQFKSNMALCVKGSGDGADGLYPPEIIEGQPSEKAQKDFNKNSKWLNSYSLEGVSSPTGKGIKQFCEELITAVGIQAFKAELISKIDALISSMTSYKTNLESSQTAITNLGEILTESKIEVPTDTARLSSALSKITSDIQLANSYRTYFNSISTGTSSNRSAINAKLADLKNDCATWISFYENASSQSTTELGDVSSGIRKGLIYWTEELVKKPDGAYTTLEGIPQLLNDAQTQLQNADTRLNAFSSDVNSWLSVPEVMGVFNQAVLNIDKSIKRWETHIMWKNVLPANKYKILRKVVTSFSGINNDAWDIQDPTVIVELNEAGFLLTEHIITPPTQHTLFRVFACDEDGSSFIRRADSFNSYSEQSDVISKPISFSELPKQEECSCLHITEEKMPFVETDFVIINDSELAQVQSVSENDLRLDDDYGEINSIKKLFGFYFATEL